MVSSLISSVRGKLEGKGPDWADVAVGGVTFRVNVPGSSVEMLGLSGDLVQLHTSLQVREDSLNLYGFLSYEARQTFDTLIGISGVGPRVALSILSTFSPASLAAAVEGSDIKAFTGVSGVGNKTASRIILELKGKLDDALALGMTSPGSDDALDALTSLGYTSVEARQALTAVNSAGEATSVEDRVRLALQELASA
ncbi:MAG: Holliday junction branch migration protein RuvA [Chloroflexi bacterium]|nr:Holliday junction branch migration protein RuvA [Chloroflexota bacterium]MDA1228177.1 Holliday junction branch migration protein RuvA [Chloroflexota bacterium]